MNVPARRGIGAAMTEGLGLPQPPRISIRGGIFTLIDRKGNKTVCQQIDQRVGRYLDVVIVAANPTKSKQYFAEHWEPDSNDPPTCHSDNGIAPSVNAITPQSATCQQCEWNKRGSDISKFSGKEIKACQDRKKLACLIVGDPNNEIYQLQVTPAALKGLVAYGKWVSGHPNAAGTGPADPSDVVTRIYFEPGQNGVIGFGAVGPIDADLNAHIDQLWQNSASVLAEITGRDDKPIQGLLPAPQQPQVQLPPPPPPAQQWAPQQAALAAPQQFVAAKPVTPPPQPVWNGSAWVLPAPVVAAPSPAAPPPPPQPVWDGTAWVLPGAPAAAAAAAPAAEAPAKGKRGGARQGAGRKPDTAKEQGAAPMQFGNGIGGAVSPFAPPTGTPASQAVQGQHTMTHATQAVTGGYPAPPAGELHPGVPPFLQRAREQQAPPAEAAPPPAQQQFGMAPAAAPPSDMSAALDRAFSAQIPPTRTP